MKESKTTPRRNVRKVTTPAKKKIPADELKNWRKMCDIIYSNIMLALKDGGTVKMEVNRPAVRVLFHSGPFVTHGPGPETSIRILLDTRIYDDEPS